jgi:hypothetical protein
MKIHGRTAFVIVFLLTVAGFIANAQEQKELQITILSHAVMVFEARQTGAIHRKKGTPVAFEIVETWKGDAKFWVNTTPKGFPYLTQGERNVHIAKGQPFVFVYGLTKEAVGGVPQLIAIYPVAGGDVLEIGLPVVKMMSVEEFKNLAMSSGYPVGMRF